MATEQAVFTAIPAGRLPDTGELKVTVFVTPKLVPDGGALTPLAEFEAFANWPKTVTDARWAVEIDGLGTFDARPIDGAIPANPELWERLFGATRVGDAEFQHFEDSVVHSYPVEEVAKAITGLYQTIARVSATDFPPITRGPLAGFVKELALPNEREGFRRAARSVVRNAQRLSDDRGRYLDIDAVPDAAKPVVALAAAAAFYDRTDDPWDEATTTASVPDPVAPEFHSFVARCADYPELLRHLGLAIDLAIPDDGGIPENTTIQLLAGQNGDPLESLLAPPDARPLTRVHRTDRFWAPGSLEEPDIVDGSLAIDDTRLFSASQIDPDGAALKVTSLISTLQRTSDEIIDSARRNNHAPSMTPDASSLPALRSAGINVARRNRAEWLVRQFERSAEHEEHRAVDGVATTLSAADVTRGWRVDIQDESGDWFSLHRRVGVYELVSPGQPSSPFPVELAPDEAYLKAASTSSNEVATTADQYLHETLAGWDGWSLAVRRPGKVVDETGPVDPTVDPAADPNQVADSGFPLAARFRPQPGSLPRLRFGRRYRLRVRAVDLSGWSIPEKQLDERHERDLEGAYQRWEPVPSPAVVPLTEYTEGESLMRMVIRSTLEVPVDDYVSLPRVSGLRGHAASGDLGLVYRVENERNLAAPLGSVQLAETHGEFDAALAGDPAQVTAQFDIAAREAGSYLTLAGARVVSTHPVPTELTGAKTDALQEGEYLVHANRALPLPYLPDPLSRGISFTTLPGDGGPSTTRLVRWPGGEPWFDRQPVLLRVVEGDTAPVFDEGSRLLTVSLPKATQATVRISSFLDEGDPEIMRVWELMAAYPPSPATSADLDLVRRGRHWMITPYGELTLVHAVEKPLEPPAIDLGSSPLRHAGTTFSLLPGTVRNHAASTGRIDIDATWEDPVDDVLAPAPSAESKAAHIADFSLLASETDAQLWPVSGPPAGPFGPRHEAKHEFGDTRHRYVDYVPTATTRFREYFPPEITGDPSLITSTGSALRIDVPSSARPAPPEVKYIVPTWEWKQSALEVEGSPFAVRRTRTGGGLRVYLARPWFSSGPDELLGVVLRIQPWITWPADRDRGVLGTLEGQSLAEGWAREVLERADVSVAEDAPVVSQLARQLATAVQQVDLGELEGLRIEAGGGGLRITRGLAVDRFGRDVVADLVQGDVDGEPVGEAHAFLERADAAISAARTPAAALTSAAVTDALIDTFPFFTVTGAEGRRFTTAWGMDPVFAGAALPAGPSIHQFPLRVAVGDSVTLAEIPTERVTVVGHQPEFDPQRRLWFCDLQIDAGWSYTPLVQLRLARYQPHSVRGQEISPTVQADFAQLLPARDATFVTSPDGSAMTVTLEGAVGVPQHAIALPDVASEVAASRRVEAWVDLLPGAATSDLDWKTVAGPVPLPVRAGSARFGAPRYASVQWAGAVALPARSTGDRLRVRIAEYELHQADPLGVPVILSAAQLRDRRLVYSDEVEVP